MSAPKRPPEQGPPASASDAAKRLATIVDAAESAAAGVIDEAEKQAQQHVQEARERADRMVAERLRELADELDPQGTEAGGLREAEPEGSRASAPHLRPVDAGPGSGEASGGDGRRSATAGARLLATQMAVSGASREEIEERLRTGFDLEDADELLDAILGPEG